MGLRLLIRLPFFGERRGDALITGGNGGAVGDRGDAVGWTELGDGWPEISGGDGTAGCVGDKFLVAGLGL